MMFDDNQAHQGFNCIWRIEDFTFLKAGQKFLLKSQIFKVNYLQKLKYHLELRQIHAHTFSVVLCVDDGPQLTKMKYSLFLLTQNGWDCLVRKIDRKFPKWIHLKCFDLEFPDSYNCGKPPNSLTFNLIIHKPETKKVISTQCFMRSRMVDEDLLHSPIQEYHFLKQSDFIHFSDPVEMISREDETADRDNSLKDTEGLIGYFREKGFSFVTLRTTEKDFAVHKALLCAKSPVFKAMFEKEMKENSTGIVDIDDIGSCTLSLMLQFLHLEPPKDLDWDEAIKLYYAADKYQVLQLRDVCSSFLKDKLSVENVCEAIALADLHDDKQLKDSAKKKFCENSKTVLRSTQWKDLLRENPDLAFDTLNALADIL